MGFTTGNVLEPACGVGNFFGMLPGSMAASNLYGTGLDSITGRIAKQLYPQANIAVQGFEKTDRRDFYDLAVGNVPFGNYKVPDRAYDKLNFNIHDYFFAKAIDQVAFVLAATIQHKNYDGRFSRGNKAWAAEIDTAFSVFPSYAPRPSFCVESYPTVLDGFVELFRKEMCRERKLSVLQKLQAKSVEPTPIKPKAPIRRSADLER